MQIGGSYGTRDCLDSKNDQDFNPSQGAWANWHPRQNLQNPKQHGCIPSSSGAEPRKCPPTATKKRKNIDCKMGCRVCNWLDTSIQGCSCHEGLAVHSLKQPVRPCNPRPIFSSMPSLAQDLQASSMLALEKNIDNANIQFTYLMDTTAIIKHVSWCLLMFKPYFLFSCNLLLLPRCSRWLPWLPSAPLRLQAHHNRSKALRK